MDSCHCLDIKFRLFCILKSLHFAQWSSVVGSFNESRVVHCYLSFWRLQNTRPLRGMLCVGPQQDLDHKLFLRGRSNNCTTFVGLSGHYKPDDVLRTLAGR